MKGRKLTRAGPSSKEGDRRKKISFLGFVGQLVVISCFICGTALCATQVLYLSQPHEETTHSLFSRSTFQKISLRRVDSTEVALPTINDDFNYKLGLENFGSLAATQNQEETEETLTQEYHELTPGGDPRVEGTDESQTVEEDIVSSGVVDDRNSEQVVEVVDLVGAEIGADDQESEIPEESDTSATVDYQRSAENEVETARSINEQREYKEEHQASPPTSTAQGVEITTASKHEDPVSESVPVSVDKPIVVEQETTVAAKPFGGGKYNGVFDGVNVKLETQIVLPQKPLYHKYNIEANFWPVTKYLKKKGWGYAPPGSPLSKASMTFTRGKVPPGLGRGTSMLNTIGLSGCIGGSKRLQLQCRQRLATAHGCSYDDLRLQPSQYSVDTPESCMAFFQRANKPENSEMLWLYKPSNSYHGAGIKLFKGPLRLWEKLNQCRRGASAIVMEYVSKPATMKGGYKFDFRSYLLVASLTPQLVFYHDGFIRKAEVVYSENDKRAKVHITNSLSQSGKDHFYNFDQLNVELQKELGFPPSFMNTTREYLKKASRYIFSTTKTQQQPLGKVKGRWHLFGIDWILDKEGKTHLLEGNGYPLVSHYEGINLTPKVWHDMIDLILTIQTEPSKLDPQMTTKAGYKYGGWSLIYNELEEGYNAQMGNAYNACKAFS